MKAIDVLAEEHIQVWRLLRCLKALVDEARVRGRLDKKAAKALLSLFEGFVDWSHQDKEELHLFPWMLSSANPTENKRLSRMFADHSQERRRLIGMILHLRDACAGSQSSLERFVTNARIYMRIQRNHLIEEELFVFPLAEMILSSEDDEEIMRGFRAIDARFGTLGDLRRRVDALCRRFGVGTMKQGTPLPALANM